MGDPIDLSDLDPFAPPSRTNSPLFPPQAPTSSSSANRSITPLQPPRLESKPTGSDPLGSISLLNFATRAKPASAPPTLPPIQPDPVRAQDQRQAAIWSDLSRQPWSAAPETMSDLETVAGPSSSGIDQFDAGPGALSIVSSHEHPHRRRSLSRSPTLSFSPPRRLSGLMEGAHPAFASRANSHTSRGETAPFHPASPPPGGASSAVRRASFGLHQPGSPVGSTFITAGADDSSFGEWTDFQTAISDAVADDFGFPVPTPPAPIPAPAPAPSAHPFSSSSSGFFSHSPIHFPSASDSSSRSASTPKPPVPQPAPRAPPKQAHSVPGPTNGHSVTGPGSKGWKKEWTYDSTGADAIQGIKLLGVKAGTNKYLSEDVAEGVSEIHLAGCVQTLTLTHLLSPLCRFARTYHPDTGSRQSGRSCIHLISTVRPSLHSTRARRAG